VFIIEPAVRYAGMAIQIEGRRLAQSAILRPKLDLWVVGWQDGVSRSEKVLL